MEILAEQVIALVVGLAFLCIAFGFLFGYSFRGWELKRSREERGKIVISILSHLNQYEREEFLNFIDGLKTSKSTS